MFISRKIVYIQRILSFEKPSDVRRYNVNVKVQYVWFFINELIVTSVFLLQTSIMFCLLNINKTNQNKIKKQIISIWSNFHSFSCFIIYTGNDVKQQLDVNEKKWKMKRRTKRQFMLDCYLLVLFNHTVLTFIYYVKHTHGDQMIKLRK